MSRKSFGMNSSRNSSKMQHSLLEDDTIQLLQVPYSQYQSHALSTLSEVNDSRFMNDTTLATIPGEISLCDLDSERHEPLENLHEHFHTILELYKGNRSTFDVIKAFVSVCSSFMHSNSPNNDVEKWLFEEKNTWQILQTLMDDRLNYINMDDGDSLIDDGSYRITEKEVMLDLFKNDAVTRQCQLVVDWLEACEAYKQAHEQTLRAEHFTDKTVSWENTIYQLKHKDIPYSSNTKIVTEIDPDAPVRQGLPIHKLDTEDEVLFLSQILSHIRCGQLEQALKLCIHCGQAWRAATLEGWRLFHNPNIGRTLTEPLKEGQLLPTEGNPNRDIWKKAAWGMSSDERMPSTARTSYAALCGNLDAMLINMKTWHDWLWAHLKAMIDVRVEEEIREKCRYRVYAEITSKYWANKLNLPQVFAALASSPNPQVRAEHTKELFTIQRFIILDDMNSLYASLASWTRQITDFRNNLSVLLVRFSAHLVLVLRALGKEPTESCSNHGNEVLRIYTQYIITLGNPKLIMPYVAKLSKHEQVPTLARYLQTVVDPELKTLCLELASREGLDAEAAAQNVVESIKSLEARQGAEFLRGEATETDLAKIEALDWLVVYPSQFAEALWQANGLARQFIASGKLEAARAAFAKLPPKTVHAVLHEQEADTSMSPRHHSAVKEHLSLKIYLDAQQEFSDWFTFYHKRPAEPAEMPRMASFQQKLLHEEQTKQFQSRLSQWKKQLTQMAKITKTRLFNILTFPDGGWLGCIEDLDDDSEETMSRQQELIALCKLCIPEVALLIHEVSMKSGEPQGSMQLVDVLASERYGLYKVFSKEKLRELLTKISEASIELLKISKDPWGHTVTS